MCAGARRVARPNIRNNTTPQPPTTTNHQHPHCSNKAGDLRLRGQTPEEVGGAPKWRADVTYVHQSRVDFPGTPFEFFDAARRLASRRAGDGGRCGDLAAIAAEMGLDAAAALNQPWSSLSGGQAQRASLAVAVALRPAVLLLDEPTSALDARSARRVEGALRRCGSALVWVTHADGQPERVGGRVLWLPGGEITTIEGGGGGGRDEEDDDGGSDDGGVGGGEVGGGVGSDVVQVAVRA